MDNPYKIVGDILSSPLFPECGFSSVDLYGASVQKKTEASACSSFHLENESGTGDITVYLAFPGMELLLMLTELDFDMGKVDYVYYSQAQRNCIRQIHDFMVDHIAEHYTIGELAERFKISPTAMKNCFKGMYGVPIYTYIRTYRLQIAEHLLREGRLSVAEIAAKIRYTNPNKFTSAFCSEYGIPPTQYQKNV